jgi:hypothetical protein
MQHKDRELPITIIDVHEATHQKAMIFLDSQRKTAQYIFDLEA